MSKFLTVADAKKIGKKVFGKDNWVPTENKIAGPFEAGIAFVAEASTVYAGAVTAKFQVMDDDGSTAGVQYIGFRKGANPEANIISAIQEFENSEDGRKTWLAVTE